jgi:hypothetical protein
MRLHAAVGPEARREPFPVFVPSSLLGGCQCEAGFDYDDTMSPNGCSGTCQCTKRYRTVTCEIMKPQIVVIAACKGGSTK